MGIFRAPKMPAQPAPVPTPTIDDATQRDENFRKLARRRGRSALIASNPAANAAPSVAAKTLLGA